MEYKEAHIKRLRKLVNDAESSIFDNDEIEELLEEAPNIYIAASNAWVVRAALLEGDIESYSSGSEKYDLTKLKDRIDHALRMASHYKGLGDEEAGASSSSSFVIGVKRPEVT